MKKNIVSLALSISIGLLLASCTAQEGSNDTAEEKKVEKMKILTVYSPAPPTNMLHKLNLDFGEMINQCSQDINLSVIPVALPDSINNINQKSIDDRKDHLPIVTTVDFLPARDSTGPEWHPYERASKDLKFVSMLYDIGFGVLAFDSSITSPSDLKGKRIGVPPRPSSIRVLSEALLRDGWGILDEVELVDITPPEVGEAIESGRIDATSWNLVHKDGSGALMPKLLDIPSARWVEIDEKTVDSINMNNPFVLSMSTMEAGRKDEVTGRYGNVHMLSFAQALTAWDQTDGNAIKAVLECVLNNDNGSVTALKWPGLTPDLLHPAAEEFYREHGITLEK